jgi:hypothetical protein
MKIVYTQNPLRSYVVLSEVEKVELKDKLYRYHRYEWEETEEDSIKWTEHQYPYVLESLTSGEEHCGDCTKVSCSCNKCYAEEVIGINTTEGLECFRYISAAFEGRDNIDDAIKYLSTPVTEYTEEWCAPHVERWDAERKVALLSLIKYKEKHFSGVFEI